MVLIIVVMVLVVMVLVVMVLVVMVLVVQVLVVLVLVVMIGCARKDGASGEGRGERGGTKVPAHDDEITINASFDLRKKRRREEGRKDGRKEEGKGGRE